MNASATPTPDGQSSPRTADALDLDALLAGLKSAAEPTRLRLLALLSQAELTVTELTQILGQSQPRVSRHLKLLGSAGLLDRFSEGTWAFYRLAEHGEAARLARVLIDLLPEDDETLSRDLARLAAVKQARATEAAAYFQTVAADWHQIRSLHVPEAEVESAMADLTPFRCAYPAGLTDTIGRKVVMQHESFFTFAFDGINDL